MQTDPPVFLDPAAQAILVEQAAIEAEFPGMLDLPVESPRCARLRRAAPRTCEALSRLCAAREVRTRRTQELSRERSVSPLPPPLPKIWRFTGGVTVRLSP